MRLLIALAAADVQAPGELLPGSDGVLSISQDSWYFSHLPEPFGSL